MTNELTSDNDLLLRGFRVIIPLILRESFLHDPIWGMCGHYQVPAHDQNTNLLAQHKNHWRLCQAVSNMYQVITYTLTTSPSISQCSPRTLTENWCRHYGLGWWKVPTYHRLFLQIPILFQMSSPTPNTIIGCLTVIFPWRNPLQVFTDNGLPFTSKEWCTFTENYGFQYTTSSPHYPYPMDSLK